MNYPRKHNWEKLQQVYDEQGLTYKQMREKFGVGINSIVKAIKRKEFVPRSNHQNSNRIENLDWISIQQDYDGGASYEQICKKYHTATKTIQKAIKLGKFTPRTRAQAAIQSRRRFPYKHTQKTKDKISRIRRKFLRDNPNKVPYLLNHSSKKSYIEEVFERELIALGIDFMYNYRHGIYQYDFAFLSCKLDVELDGNTHTTEAVKKIDRRRDRWTRAQGWNVLRFTGKEIKSNLSGCIQHLIKVLKQ